MGSNNSLGDWFVNEEKLPTGLDDLAKKVNEIGLKFGIWFEPEMISPDSELYRAHPDWAIQIRGRAHILWIYRREGFWRFYQQIVSFCENTV